MCQKGWLSGLSIWFSIAIVPELHNLIHPLLLVGAGYADESHPPLWASPSSGERTAVVEQRAGPKSLLLL